MQTQTATAAGTTMGKVFDLTRNGRLIKGLNEEQLRGLLDWQHCDGEHQGVKVNSLFIARAGDTKIAIAQGEGLENIVVIESPDLLVAIGPMTSLGHQVFNDARAAGRI